MHESTPDIDAEDVEAVTAAVLTASRLLVSVSARSLGATGERVTLPQFRMLVVLAGRGESKLVTLAERLAVNPSTAMRMVDRLTAAGLVSREVNPESRREVQLRLTPVGRLIVDQVTMHRRKEIAAIVARMPPRQRAGLVTALRAFSEAGGEPPAGEVAPLAGLWLGVSGTAWLGVSGTAWLGVIGACRFWLKALCGTGASRPRARARSMASRRRWAPSLSYTCRMCVRIVFTDT